MMTHLKLDEKEYTKLCREVNIASMTSIQSLTNPDNDEQDELELADFREVKDRDKDELKEVLKKNHH